MKPVQWALLSAGLITFAMAAPSCDVDCVTTLTCDPPSAMGTGGGSGSQSSSASQGSTGAEGGGGTAVASSGAGGAGGAGCIGEQGTGKDKKSCDSMSITPSSAGGTAASVCGGGMNAPPPGYAVCQHGFDVLTPGVAEDLRGCLSQIGGDSVNACDTKQVSACVSGSLKDACDRPEATARCEDTSQLCKTGMLDLTVCASNLKALNDATLDKYTLCMQSAVETKDCQDAHYDCYDMLLSS